MKLKTVTVRGTDGKDVTYAVVQDDKPVFIEDDGKEVAYDVPSTKATITRLNGEAKGHREAKEAAEAKLKPFEGITDPAAAVKALETIKNIDQSKLVEAGKVEEIKRETAKGYEDKIVAAAKTHADEVAKLTGERDTVTKQFQGEQRKTAFAGSKFIAEKAAVPADLVQARFDQNFKFEDGKMVAYDGSGNKVFSKARPGELATFDEAIEILVDQYPYRDQILKGKGGGSGGGPGNGGGAGGKTISRGDFEKLGHPERAAKMKEGFKLTD